MSGSGPARRLPGPRGKKWGGRKPGTRIKVTEAKERIIRQMKDEEQPITEIARTVEVSRQSIYTVLARQEAHRKRRKHR